MSYSGKKEFVAWWLIVAVCSVLGTAILVVGGLYIYGWTAPREEAIRRATFEQSKAYNDGVQQELADMIFQYEKADASHKDALATVILHKMSAYDLDQLPSDEHAFVQKLRDARMGVTP